MKKISLFFVLILLFGCQQITNNSNKFVKIDCPNVFFSSENKVYSEGNINNLDLEQINFKASLNNYAFTNDCFFDSVNNKVVFITKDGGDLNEAKCIVGNVSGDSVTFGSPIDISGGQTSTVAIDFDSDVGKPVLGYVDNSGNYYFTRVSISGTTPTAETARDTGTNAHNLSVSLTYHKAAEKVILTGADANNGYGFGYTLKMSNISTNLTAENYIGIANAAYSNGATATAQIVGSIDDAQSGLTPGKKYYVQTNGSLDVGAASPSVVAGTAVSATKLIVKG